MTEEEALGKWCPFVRADDKASNGRAINRWLGKEHLPLGTKCIASACMAWRTRPIRSHEQDVMRDGTAVNPPMNSVSLDGFCGLAGAPQ